MEKNSVDEKTRARKLFLLALLFLFLYLTYRLFRPYVGTVVFAIVLTSVCYRFHRRILQWCKDKKNLAAFLTTILLVVIVVVPLVGFCAVLVNQGAESFGQVNSWLKEGNIERMLSWEWIQPLRNMVNGQLARLGFEELNVRKIILDGSAALGQLILSWGKDFLGNVTGLVVRCLLLILLVFYFVRDGQAILGGIKHLSPLSEEQEEKLIQRVRDLSRSVVMANGATAAAQGFAGGIGLWIAGIPPLFWGTMMAFTSLIPAVGTAIVWVPAVVYLLLINSWGKALFLAIWSMVVVGSIDNFLRPYLMKGEGGISSFYLFFAILGGIHLFGIAGILYGPLILGVTAILLYLYELEYKDVLAEE
ncbi:MAG: AI-2E family transporter [Deltaproteobacteria bacterium]|nr:MAG: AI-2E family transporter [Deltaproteobacteria bacterium]